MKKIAFSTHKKLWVMNQYPENPILFKDIFP